MTEEEQVAAQKFVQDTAAAITAAHDALENLKPFAATTDELKERMLKVDNWAIDDLRRRLMKVGGKLVDEWADALQDLEATERVFVTELVVCAALTMVALKDRLRLAHSPERFALVAYSIYESILKEMNYATDLEYQKQIELMRLKDRFMHESFGLSAQFDRMKAGEEGPDDVS